MERKYPSFGNLAPRDISSRSAKEACDEGRGVGPGGRGVYLDFGDSINRLGENTIRERYGNLFEMYERITGENAYQRPMRIYPAIHYTMGGLWVDYNLMSSIPGCFVLGEANFSDHGANRLGASALMQGLSDGYFVIPYTIGNYLTTISPGGIDPEGEAARETLESVKKGSIKWSLPRGNDLPVPITKNLDKLCGNTQVWPETRQALKKQSVRFRICVMILTKTCWLPVMEKN